MTESVGKDWLTVGLAGLGITFAPVHEYLGGLLLGLAGAGLATHFRPEANRIELFWVLVGGFFGSHVAALVGHLWLPGLPIQLTMTAGGFSFRFVARFAVRALGRVETKSDQIVDVVANRVLPSKGDRQ